MRERTEEETRALRFLREQEAIVAKRRRAALLLRGNASRRRDLGDKFAPLNNRDRRT